MSIDVGQIIFGQTVTASGDTMMQFKNAPLASPRKWVLGDIECDAGCGVVPFRYREQSYVNALQRIIGLEISLLVDDPWRVSMTTDHPNGAPFTSYPHLIRLLMDKSFHDERLDTLHADAKTASARDGTLLRTPTGGIHYVIPDYDRGIEKHAREFTEANLASRFENAASGDDEICACCNGGRLLPVACFASDRR